MNRKNHIRGKQNKGFTLVEVLVAITVLAIIVAPLLHAFVTASRTNAKAKQLMKATTLAQNVMEELKANPLEEIARQFNGYQSSNSLSGLGTAMEAEKVDDEYKAVTNPSVIAAANPETNPEGCFVGQSSGEYHFLLQGVQRESAKFDIAIELLKDAENGTQTLTQINAMNQSDCGYYAEGNVNSNAVTSFANANDTYETNPNCLGSLSNNDIYTILDRTITVDIVSSGGNETVNVRYDYEIDPGYTLEEDRYYSESITIFDNYLSGEDLKAIYVYFYPLYESEDTIQIVNNNDLDVDVYLIKMKGVPYSQFADDNYDPKVVLTETSKATDNKSHATICSNIKKTDRFEYNVPNGLPRKSDLGNEKSVDCFYDVKIDVYKHDSTSPFNESNRITSFTGSMMDNSNKVSR